MGSQDGPQEITKLQNVSQKVLEESELNRFFWQKLFHMARAAHFEREQTHYTSVVKAVRAVHPW